MTETTTSSDDIRVSITEYSYAGVFSRIANGLGNILLQLEFEGNIYVKAVQTNKELDYYFEVVDECIIYYNTPYQGKDKLVIQKITNIPKHGECAISKGWIPLEEYKHSEYIGVVNASNLLHSAIRVANDDTVFCLIEFIRNSPNRLVTNQQALEFLQS